LGGFFAIAGGNTKHNQEKNKVSVKIAQNLAQMASPVLLLKVGIFYLFLLSSISKKQ
jgi:hypothetical protein